MITLKETREKIANDRRWWCIHLMNFVDDFRRHRDVRAIEESFEFCDDYKVNALLAATAECLCDEVQLTPPAWLSTVPECKDPWFVSDFERLKAIAIVESPLRCRMRKIFVCENFLSRV
jgi:hypothetical protein